MQLPWGFNCTQAQLIVINTGSYEHFILKLCRFGQSQLPESILSLL